MTTSDDPYFVEEIFNFNLANITFLELVVIYDFEFRYS